MRGGWHASTKLGCFLTYQSVFIIICLLNECHFPLSLSVFVYFFSFIYLYFNSPVEHIYNPLTVAERISNKKKARRSAIYLTIFFVFLVFANSRYSCVLSLVIFWNSICMEMLKHTKYWRKPDEN
ncbi:MAG: accessory gene regulator B family protein [Erysipelotrichaceae bacterium]|nr:accessory gene regulator B family protein [Erysipelotrichaceae bacterium]